MSLMAAVFTFAILSQDQRSPRGEYLPQNAYIALEITDAKATYVPFKHDAARPNECLSSTITFTFTIQNKGKRAVQLPKYLAFEVNNPKPFYRNSVPLDLVEHPEKDVVFGDNIMFRGSERKTLNPNERIQVTSERVPPHGPWNPMKLSARLAEDAAGDMVWVGVERPFSATLVVEAPDYQPKQTVSLPADGKPESEARLWNMSAFFQLTGKPAGGPIQMTLRVFQKGSKSRIALSAGAEVDNDTPSNSPTGAYAFLAEKVSISGPPDFERVEASIKVGCPKHKFQRLLVDANPSNDTRILKRGN